MNVVMRVKLIHRLRFQPQSAQSSQRTLRDDQSGRRSLKIKQAMNTGKKILILVPHALERMKERSIDKEEVIAALSYPDYIDCQEEKRKIAQRFIEGKLLRVVYEEEEDPIIVVSVYRTSKYNKYIRRY